MSEQTIEPSEPEEPEVAEKSSLFTRFHDALGPVAVGLTLDFLDLATFGPIGLYLGVVVGGFAGWWLGGIEGCGRTGRSILAVLSAIYITIPLTEPLPIATIIGAFARFLRAPREPGRDAES